LVSFWTAFGGAISSLCSGAFLAASCGPLATRFCPENAFYKAAKLRFKINNNFKAIKSFKNAVL